MLTFYRWHFRRWGYLLKSELGYLLYIMSAVQKNNNKPLASMYSPDVVSESLRSTLPSTLAVPTL